MHLGISLEGAKIGAEILQVFETALIICIPWNYRNARRAVSLAMVADNLVTQISPVQPRSGLKV